MARLLLIEGDETTGHRLHAALTAAGYHVVWQRTGAGALFEAARTDFDLVVLNLCLPDRDGVEVCRDLRVRRPGVVLMMLAARRDEMDVVVGLEAGADDYVTTPLGMAQLIARIRAHLRRARIGEPVGAEVFSDGDLLLELSARRCSVGGQEVQLRTREFDLLARLVRSAGRPVSRRALIADVWDENWSGSTKTLDVHVGAVRRRLAAAVARAGTGAPVPEITTLRGHGFRLDPVEARD